MIMRLQKQEGRGRHQGGGQGAQQQAASANRF